MGAALGCGSNKDVVAKIGEQEKKIDDLIRINKELEQKLNEMQINNENDARHSHDKGDVTSLKTTIDIRFSRLEKTVEKIHNEFKLKLFEGIGDNIAGDEGSNKPEESLDLDFGKEKEGLQSNHYQRKTPNDARPETGSRIASHNQIKVDVSNQPRNVGNATDLNSKKGIKTFGETGKDILDDEEIKRIHEQVRNTMFKGAVKA